MRQSLRPAEMRGVSTGEPGGREPGRRLEQKEASMPGWGPLERR